METKVLLACRQEQLALSVQAKFVQAAGEQPSAQPIACEITDLQGALLRAALGKPDVLLLEHADGQDPDALDILSRLHQVSPDTRVLLLCAACTPLTVIDYIQRGASGFLPLSSEPWQYAKAVTAVSRGEAWYGRSALLQALRSQIIVAPIVTSTSTPKHDSLTARENEILSLIRVAMSNKEIARVLQISEQTVKTHLHHIYVKLQKSGRYKVLLPHPAAQSVSPAPMKLQ